MGKAALQKAVFILLLFIKEGIKAKQTKHTR